MSDFPPGRPLETFRQYVRSRQQQSSSAAAQAPFWGTRTNLSAKMRYDAGDGGDLIDADTMIWFTFDDNGGWIDIIDGDTLVDPLTGIAFSVTAVEIEHATVKVTCSTAGPRTGSTIG